MLGPIHYATAFFMQGICVLACVWAKLLLLKGVKLKDCMEELKECIFFLHFWIDVVPPLNILYSST